jgi:hypothetical protein
MADYLPSTEAFGNLRAICPDCDSMIYRRVNLSKLGAIADGLDIAFPQALSRIEEGRCPSLNCDLGEEPQSHANA